ncbi:MAG: folylpolyglutamate synthase/dihydrofolate synthase family protein [Bacteroidota bacterium]|nr:folylpolyglutamate synthase/dihydrofolate synthase family protein [Bacteroidota bacterium]
MTYNEALAFIFEQTPMYTRDGAGAYKPGLQNITQICNYLGNPQNKFKTIHIAGTNGKGSTSHMLAAILQTSGYKTGLYTSPHLKKFTERIKINGIEITENEVVEFITSNYEFLKSMDASFFEITTALAFKYFADNQIDIAVIETGLGGRLDATNIITPELSIITNIGWDHMDLLGDSLEKIAFEKAGIIKPNIPVIISENQPEIRHVFEEKATQNNSNIYFTDDIDLITPNPNENPMRLDILIDNQIFIENALCELSGKFQLNNIKAVIKASEILKNKKYRITNVNLIKALLEVKSLTNFKGRWQRLNNKPLLIVDGAHNEQGIRQNVQQISEIDFQNLFMVIGFSKDKEIDKILSLLPVHAYYFFTDFTSKRSLPKSELFDKSKKYHLNGEIAPNVNIAIKNALKTAKNDDLIFVGGSLYLVGEIEML